MLGYMRFKKQLRALTHGDIKTVRRLGFEARRELDLKREQNLRLPLVN